LQWTIGIPQYQNPKPHNLVCDVQSLSLFASFFQARAGALAEHRNLKEVVPKEACLWSFVHKEEGGQFQAEWAWRTIHAQSRTDSSKKPFCILNNYYFKIIWYQSNSHNMCQGNFLLDTTMELENNMNENKEENSYSLEVEQIDDESFNEFMMDRT
jgi:hypothetical protein